MSEEEKKAVDNLNEKDAKEILKELLEFEKREARYQKFTSILILCLVVILGIVSFMIVPVALETLKTANTTIIMAQDALSKISAEMDNINGMVSSITATSNNVNSMVEANSQDLTNAVKDLSSINFEGLNQAISDLQAAVGPLANMSRLFG